MVRPRRSGATRLCLQPTSAPRALRKPPMLRLENLTVRYGPVAAVKGITLTVEEGEVVGMVGPNGAGKPTTLNAITRLVSPSGGDILFEGESIVGELPERLVRRGIALVPEGRRIFG